MRLLPGLPPDPAGGHTCPLDPQLGKIVHPEKSVTYFFFPNDMPAFCRHTHNYTFIFKLRNEYYKKLSLIQIQLFMYNILIAQN